MRADIGIMRNATNVLAQRSQAVRAVDLPGMVEQFGSSVLAELDYRGEAYNAHVLSRNLAGLEGVQVPKMYYDLCTSRVLTMEFISGVKISKIGTIEAAGLDRPRLARNATRAVIKMLLIDGFFHADPHPGNVLVNLETGMITLLDTGMVGHLDLQNRITLIQFILAFKNHDINAMGLLLLDLSTPFMEPVDEQGYLREFERMVNQYMLLGDPELGFGPVVSDSLELLRKYGLRLDPDLTMAFKALMQIEAISALLYPEGGIVSEGAEMIRELAVQEITADRVVEVAKKQITLTARQALRQLPSLQSAAMSWLTQFRRGKFEVHVDMTGLGQEISRLNRIGRIAVIGILLAGMLIASSNATAFLAQVRQEGDIWSVVGQVAYLGYLFSMLAAVIIVAKLIWDWWHKKDDI
jgi:ubiquinone biosynthesis protein